MTVPPTTMRTTRCAPRLLSFGPLRVTLPVQLPFRLVSPLSSLPRARRSSTTRTFFERDRPSAYARTTWPSRCVVRDRTPARTPTPPHLDVPHMGPSHPTLPRDSPTARVSHSGFHRYANARNQGEGSGARFARARARANLENFPSQIPPAAASPCISHVRVLVQLTIDEIPLGLVFRDGLARLYASRRS